MPRLGVLLVRAGALTEESVYRALAIQGFAGGRIGTLLIERGSVSEDDVGKALAEQHGCDYVPWRALGSVSATVTAALPAKFAIRHSAIPVELNENFLRIVLRDPANLRILDELFFVTGKKIVPATAPEVRIYQALEKYYGERRTPRFAILAEKLSRPTIASVIKNKPLPPPPDFSATPKPMPGDPVPSADLNGERNATPLWKLVPDEPPVGWGGLAPSPEEVSDEELESIPYEELPPQPPWQPDASDSRSRSAAASGSSRPSARRPPPSSEPAPPPPPQKAGMPSPADFASILGARERDEVFAVVLAVLARRFRRSALLAVRPEGVVGWAGQGERVRAEALRALDIPWSEPSLFLNVRMSRSFYLGPLPPLPRHKELAEALGGWPVECLVQPVLMREKTVAFLYVECASAQGATPADLTFVRELAGATAAALAAAIRLKKQRVI
jgi:hypothetical protein